MQIKLRAIRNQTVHLLVDSPFKVLVTLACIAAVWLGLYGLFRMIFNYFEQSSLEAAIAIPMVFNYFFVAMLVMLAISNAIIAYSSLFTMDEAEFLLSTPVKPRSYVLLKYLETLIFSSWSLIIMGLPLMIAMADVHDEPWIYYPFFLAYFVFFVPIPGAVGLLLAWIMARFMSRNVRRRIITVLAVAAAAGTVWFIRSVQVGEDGSTRWLSNFLYKISFIQSALLPSSWVAKGVESSIQFRTGDAIAYLVVTISNAAFLSMLAVTVVSRKFSVAFDRALSAGGSVARRASTPHAGVAGRVFFYLPKYMRLVAAKDLRMFIRDPLQWTQLGVLSGLMVLYLVNLPRFSNVTPLDGWGMIIPFLNFGALSFILATFTSRFVFPLVSLEGRQMWLIGLLPLSSAQILAAKFAFAMTVSLSVALSTTVLAAVVLQMPFDWALIQIGVTVAVCTGLCGLAVGTGARLPEFNQRSAARIANGFGGTVNLILSVGLVMSMLVGMGFIGWYNKDYGFQNSVNLDTVVIAILVSAIGVFGGAFALWIGARHLSRAEI